MERELKNSDGLHEFLDDLSDLDSVKNDDRSLEATTGTTGLSAANSDYCSKCNHSVEDECVRCGERRWHRACLQCSKCLR